QLGGWPVGPRPGGAERRDGHQDRVVGAVDDRGRNDDVGLVERGGQPLVAVEVVEQHTRAPPAQRITTRRLDLDDLGAGVRQDLRAVRAGDLGRVVEHPHAAQGVHYRRPSGRRSGWIHAGALRSLNAMYPSIASDPRMLAAMEMRSYRPYQPSRVRLMSMRADGAVRAHCVSTSVAASSSESWGTTREISPHSTASSADSVRPVNMRSRVRATPTWRVRICA